MLARDCVASIKRWGARDCYGQALMAATDELSAADDKTIVFRLKRPFPLLPDALGKTPPSICAIMPERLASTDPYQQVTEMVGSGPYRYKADERVPGSRVVYERFADYVPRPDGTPSGTAGPKLAHFDRVEWRIIPDGGTVAAALQQGEVDWWLLPNADLLPVLKRDKKLAVRVTDPTGFVATMRFNQLHPPFDNPAIRRALIGAVTQADYMIGMVGTDPSLWKDRCGYFCPGTPMASDAGMAALTGPRDLAKVKRDLDAAGYKGEKIVLLGADRHRERQGAGRHHRRSPEAARPQRRLPGDGLGDAGAAPRQEGAGRSGRLEHLPHLVERHRPDEPGRPRLPARQRPGRAPSAGRPAPGSRNCATRGFRRPTSRRRNRWRPRSSSRPSPTFPISRSASISRRRPTGPISAAC